MKMLRYAVLALIAPAIGAACAASINENSTSTSGGGQGGSAGGAGGAGGATASSSSSSSGQPGTCVVAKDCPANPNPCVQVACINGMCATQPANDFGACDDGNFCTDNDTCQGGVCQGGTAKNCPSNDACHVGVCDQQLGACKNIPGNDGAQCDDMNACTYAGVCQAGACTAGAPVDCTVFDGQCTVGICVPGMGCQPQAKNEGADCDDGQGDPCSSGKCMAGTCTSIGKPDGTACDDNFFCTINDHCQGGMCSGDPNPCVPPADPCKTGVCQEATQSCIITPGNNGASCEDGNPCTAGETCSNGSCIGGLPANNGIVCDDGNGCTGGTTCTNGVCGNAQSQILVCQSGDNCCPAGCNLVNDADCLYWASGVQQNVPNATLQGWTKCYSGTYNDNNGSLSTILQTCNKSKLLMACRPVNAANWTLLAMAPRADVTFDCGQQNNCTKQSNGVGWYYSTTYSWGFAPGGQAVNRSSCDYNAGNQPFATQRLCWHTGGSNINTGYRCGDNSLNFDPGWERAVFHAD